MNIVEGYNSINAVDLNEWNDAYYSTYTKWYSSKDMDKMGIPTELK